MVCKCVTSRLPHPKYCSGTYLIVGRELVEFIETLEPHTVFLGNGVHAFPWLYDMWPVLELLRSLFTFLLQEHNIPSNQSVILIALIITGQFAIANVHFLSYTAERVAIARQQIVIVIEYMDRMERPPSVHRFVGTTV